MLQQLNRIIDSISYNLQQKGSTLKISLDITAETQSIDVNNRAGIE